MSLKDNTKVAFGDCNLSEGAPNGAHGAGSKGWPTIKYFNAACPDGCHYEQKTSDAVCTELGNDKYMMEYIREAAGLEGDAAAAAAGGAAPPADEL